MENLLVKVPLNFLGANKMTNITPSYPLVSVVIVTWNRQEDILKTVQSVYDQSYRNVEIIVVDNASTDDSVEALSQAYPDANIIRLDRNMGPTGGRNAGVVASQGDIIFILDSDASVERDTLTKVVRKFQADQNLGVIACKVVNYYTKQFDSVAGWIFSEKDKIDQDKEFLSWSFSECGCAIRKSAFNKAGLFWDFLFFGREGEDLAVRIWDAGYRILYSPEALVYHRVSSSERVKGGNRLYYDLRNSLYVYLVRYPWWMAAGFVSLKVALSLVKGLRGGCSSTVLRAFLDVIRHFPFLLKERKPISNKTAIHYIKLQREHGPLRWDLVSWLKCKT